MKDNPSPAMDAMQPTTCIRCAQKEWNQKREVKTNKQAPGPKWQESDRTVETTEGTLKIRTTPPNTDTPEEGNLEEKETVMDTDIGQQTQTEQITPRVLTHEITPGTANDNDDTLPPETTGTEKSSKQNKDDKKQKEDLNTGRTQ